MILMQSLLCCYITKKEDTNSSYDSLSKFYDNTIVTVNERLQAVRRLGFSKSFNVRTAYATKL
ncbi:hypothetical protein FVB9288_01996 [Flavobacterium sp. CECT 9288]|nr:hypothetical protein FVB9288_01996 [Flavobacterium sp. CECT 9288]